ncbi:MAG TPA: sigma-54 dependent transcriptional regulator [Pirellulales bacterium]|nr:sigma-54 dependent transcriptional regulator [Pirellulales bacterium]
MPRVLVIDGDRAVLHSVRQTLAKTGLQVSTVRTVNRAPAMIRQRGPDLIVVDFALIAPLRSSLAQSGAALSRPPVLVTSASPSPRAIIEAMKLPAVDILSKPLDYSRLQQTVLRLLAAPEPGRMEATADLTPGRSFVAECAAMHDVVRKVSWAAAQDVTVLLTGEAGTGKTHLARLIHRYEARTGPFVEFDLAGKPADRLEGELFGYERPRGPGHGRRLGWLERCQGGTLLFDDIDALPMQVQSRLLTVFERRQLRRVGGEEEIPVRARLFAATRRNLERLIAEGRFRADLYHSLRDFSIALPPLRERLDDLPQLAQWFLRRIGSQAITGITRDAIDLLRAHGWPGNLWELESVLRQAAWRCLGGVISPDDLPAPLRPARPASATRVELPAPGMEALEAYLAEALKTDARRIYPECLALFDRYLCRRVLADTRGNQSRAARLLGMTRRSLRTKLRRLETPAK